MTDIAMLLGLFGVVFAPLGWLLEAVGRRNPDELARDDYMAYWYRGCLFLGRWARRLGLAGMAGAIILFGASPE